MDTLELWDRSRLNRNNARVLATRVEALAGEIVDRWVLSLW